MNDHGELALHSPERLALSPAFLLEQRWPLAIMAIAVIGGCLLFSVLNSAGGGPVWIPALVIHSIVFWGIWIGIHTLAELEVGHAIARKVGSRTTRDLRRIEAGEIGRGDLDTLSTRYLPANVQPGLDIIRLFSQIVREAKDRRFSSSSILMQPFRERAFGGLFRLQSLQRVALQLGILGTFCGLVWALKEIRLSSNGFQVNGVADLLDSLSLAFGTSIAGIEVAILLKILVLYIIRCQKEYFHAMEEATVSFTSLARNSINDDEYLAELGEVQGAIRQVSDRILRQSESIEVQTSAIQEGMKRIAEARAHLYNFSEELKEEQTELLSELAEIYETLSPERLADRTTASLEAGGQALLQSVENSLHTLFGRFQDAVEPLGSIEGALRAVSETQGQGLEEIGTLRATFSGASDRLASLVCELEEQKREWLHSIVSERIDSRSSSDLGADTSDIGSIAQTMANSLNKFSMDARRHNGDLLQQITKLRADIESQRKEARWVNIGAFVAMILVLLWLVSGGWRYLL